MEKLKDFHIVSEKQNENWNCGIYSVYNAIKAKCLMREISENITIDSVMKVWDRDGQGFMLPLINSVRRFEDKDIDGISVYHTFQGEEKNIGLYIKNMVTPIIAIKFAGRNRYKGNMAYTSKIGRTRNHILCVIEEVDGDLKCSDSAYGDISWIRKEDRSIIQDVVYFNAKTYKKKLIYPVDSVYITQKFGVNIEAYSQFGGYWATIGHIGIDLRAGMGTPIKASHDGIIMKQKISSGYGNYMELDGGKYLTKYAHLQSFVFNAGESVKQGTIIAYSGNTGNSTGPHLHFELWEDNKPVNPLNYL